MPTELVVADFFVQSSVQSAEFCVEDIVANTKGKTKKGGENQKWPRSGPSGYITTTVWGAPTLQSRGQNQ